MTTHALDAVVKAQHAGEHVGSASICSAHPTVLDEAVRRGVRRGQTVLIEATCNQVNQDGGYTGMRPIDFLREVEELAAAHGLPAERLVLGGDHLGPNPWKQMPAAEAMAKSEVLVRDFVAAGYSKIHLDASMACADDPGVLAPAVIAERTARLAVIAEEAAASSGYEPRYVIGTEVPVPGGESAGAHGIHVTTVEDADRDPAGTCLPVPAGAVQRGGIGQARCRTGVLAAGQGQGGSRRLPGAGDRLKCEMPIGSGTTWTSDCRVM